MSAAGWVGASKRSAAMWALTRGRADALGLSTTWILPLHSSVAVDRALHLDFADAMFPPELPKVPE